MSNRIPRRLRIAFVVSAGFLVSSLCFAFETVVVTSNADVVTTCSTLGTGECTLRDAILFSNAHPQPLLTSNLIQFDIPGAGVHTIALASDLPTITAAVVIDGYSQPGTSPNALAVGDDAVLLISVKGNTNTTRLFAVDDGTGKGFSGRTVGGSAIRGLVLNHGGFNNAWSGEGIVLDSCCNQIAGNFMGLDPSGSITTPPIIGGGFVEIHSAANAIGGSTPAARNVIAGFESGLINIRGDVNVVKGNYIGTNASGTAVVSVGQTTFGLFVQSSGNTIGGSTADDRNVISGNQADGIMIINRGGQGGGGNVIASNFIGTDATGFVPLPNGNGVHIWNGNGNSVGISSARTAGNRIAFNHGTGVLIETREPSNIDYPRFNEVLYNSIFSNGGLGIDLGFSPDPPDPAIHGPTPNDLCDNDVGPNLLQNYPVLTVAATGRVVATALSSKTQIEGTLNSMPGKKYLIQFFSNQACHPSGFGEGETFIGELFVTISRFVWLNRPCDVSFTLSVPVADAPPGRFITATATDPDGNTSEFSACRLVVGLNRRPRILFLIAGPIRVAPGAPIEFPFQVKAKRGQAGDLTGEVVVSDHAGDLCRTAISPNGKGSCRLTFGTPGNFRVRAHYLGSQSFEESTSEPVVVHVGIRD